MPVGLMGSGGGLTKLRSASARYDDVVSGKTFYAGDTKLKTGTLPDQGDWSANIGVGSSITIPFGRHSGTGVVRSNAPNVAFAARIKVANAFLTEGLNGNGARVDHQTVYATISSYFAWVLINSADINQASYYSGWRNAGEVICSVNNTNPVWTYVLRIY